MHKGANIMGSMSFNSAGSPLRGRAAANENRAQKTTQTPEIKGLCALCGATYVTVSDGVGLMDDDLFELLLELEEAPAQ